MNNVTHRTAVERNPDLSTALIGMGQTLFSNRLFPEASECFKHAIEKVCCYLRWFSALQNYDLRQKFKT